MHISDDNLVTIPGGPFLLGASYDKIDERLRLADRKRSLGLGAILDGTPANVVNVPTFQIMAKMVTNGEYRTFWDVPHPEGEGYLVEDSEIWEYIWQLYGVERVRVSTGKQRAVEVELYEDCETCIDALIRSYAYECQRILLGRHIQLSLYGYNDMSKAIVRVFAALRRGLQHVVWSEDVNFAAGELQAFDDGIATPDAVATDVQTVLHGLAEYIPPQMSQQVPLLVLLKRLADALARDASLTFTVRDLFRPMSWREQTANKPGKKKIFGQQRMAWEDIPVRGVSLYEAAAFAAWMRISTDQPYALPSEAEYEKAFGWVAEDSGDMHARKHVYPWQTHSEVDFHGYFARQSTTDLEAKATAYRQLLDDTARETAHGTLYQGVGFGWQWTRERYSELESKYNRFQRSTTTKNHGSKAFNYVDCVDRECRFFCVRGSPDQLGGPGTVTRRFALSPLRGYIECGFRCVISAAGEM